ncbi:unnamed protein product, partial [Pylaiella littoralis]
NNFPEPVAVLVTDSWRDSHVDLLKEPKRRRCGFRDVDPTSEFMISSRGGRPKKGAPVQNKNALDGGNYFRNLYSVLPLSVRGYDCSPARLRANLSPNSGTLVGRYRHASALVCA